MSLKMGDKMFVLWCVTWSVLWSGSGEVQLAALVQFGLSLYVPVYTVPLEPAWVYRFHDRVLSWNLYTQTGSNGTGYTGKSK